MTALPSRAYRDPLDILIDAENRTCKGCIMKSRLWGVDYCAKDESKSGKKLRRCKNYDDGGTDGK